jgi:hypothetical protein
MPKTLPWEKPVKLTTRDDAYPSPPHRVSVTESTATT